MESDAAFMAMWQGPLAAGEGMGEGGVAVQTAVEAWLPIDTGPQEHVTAAVAKFAGAVAVGEQRRKWSAAFEAVFFHF